MYDKLARGHATQVFSRTQDIGVLDQWFNSPRRHQLTEDFDRSCLSKKPGRVLQRLAKSTSRVFLPPRIRTWSKNDKCAYAYTFSKSSAVSVSASSEDPSIRFDEAAILFNHLDIRKRYGVTLCGEA